MTAIRGLRGATTVDVDDPTAIIDATRELLLELVGANGFEPQDVAAAWFTTTPDLCSEFPAVAARQLGWMDVPLLCGHEMDVPYDNPRSIARAVRVMILLNTDRPQSALRPQYLRGAAVIREELERARVGQPPQPAAAVHGPRPSGASS